MGENRPDLHEVPSMAELLREPNELQRPHPGEIRRGEIVAVSEKGVTVRIDGKGEGLVPPADLSRLPADRRESLREGQPAFVYVTDVDNANGQVHLSLYLAGKEWDWLRAEQLLQEDGIWEGCASGYNKGGLIVPFGHIRGFVPASQVTGIPRNLSPQNRMGRLAQLVGQRLAFKVIEVNRRQRRLVLSEQQGRTVRRALQQERALSQLRRGRTCRGKIRTLTEYGAFVDLGGIVGLIHRTELAWFRVEHPSEIVQEGQEVEVLVLRVQKKQGRVSLSLKQTYPDPWPAATERYQLDELVEGRVIRRTGAALFVLLDDGVVGIVSESDLQRSNRTEQEIAIGQRVLARVIRIDGARRRLGLSLRRVGAAELADWKNRSGPQLDEDKSTEAGHALTEGS